MKILRTVVFALFIAIVAHSGLAHAATPEDLVRDSNTALHTLVTTNPLAGDLSKRAKAVLIFPNIVKAGFIFGGAYGVFLRRGAWSTATITRFPHHGDCRQVHSLMAMSCF